MNPLLDLLQGNGPDAPTPPPPPESGGSSRSAVAAGPTLAMAGRQAPVEPTAGPQGSSVAPAIPTPGPARDVAQQGAQTAQVPPKFNLPTVEEMVDDYHRWQMMASDPDVAKIIAPRMAAWKNLTMQQHAKSFQGDPTSSPEQAAAYARHMGQIQGQLGTPMPWEEAAKIAEYTQGQKAKLPQRFIAGMDRYDKAEVQPFIDDIFGSGWKLQRLGPTKTNVGGNEMEVPSITIVGPNGETKTHTSLEVSTLFGNYEGAVKLAELNRKRDIESAQAELDLARANQDSVAAAAAFERLTTLRGGVGNIKTGAPAQAGSLQYMPTINSALNKTGSSLDPLFVLSILHHESRGNPKATSPKNAQGLMQLIPETAQRFGVKNPYDPEDNILGGVKYLNFLNDRYGGDLNKVAAAYNAGEGRVDQYGGIPPFKETRAYVSDVIGTYKRHKGDVDPDQRVLGERLVRMPIGSTAETKTAGYTPAAVAKLEQAKNNYVKEQATIRRKGLGAKEERRLLDDLEQSYRDTYGDAFELFRQQPVATASTANPPGMPYQPPGSYGRPQPTQPQASPPAAPASGKKAKTDEELRALIDAAYG